jgi:hypothetical protein
MPKDRYVSSNDTQQGNALSRLPFEYWRDRELFWARFVADGEPPVRSHWPGLSDVEAIDAIETKQWLNLAINNNNQEEVAVYLRLAWGMLRHRVILGNAYYYSGDAAEELKQPGTIVRWQFEVDAEGPPGYAAALGFTPARSSVVIRPEPTEHQLYMRDKTLLFRLREFGEIAILLRNVLGDASGEISLLGTTESGIAGITEGLRGESRPDLFTLLGATDVFVDVGIGVDLGNNDYILMASKEPLEPRLELVRREAEKAIDDYERAMNPYTPPYEALRLMEKLGGL